jgi:Tfp pilus assembly protein PilF
VASPAEQHFRQGVAALDRQDLAAAERAFRAGLSKDSGLVGAMLGLAEVARRRSQPKVYEEYLAKALAQAPDSPEVQVNWGRFKAAQQQLDAAERAFRKAVDLDPRHAPAWTNLGDFLYLHRARPADAVAAYRRALELDPALAGTHYALGVALARAGDFSGAERELSEAHRLAPANPRPLLELADLLVRQKQLDKARGVLDVLVASHPALPAAYVARGDVRLATGDEAGALKDYEQARRADPNAAAPHVRLGLVHQERGRFDLAEAAYESAVRLDPKAAVALNNLAWLAVERGKRLDRAVAWASAAVQLDPANAQYLDTLAWAYRAQRDLPRAEATLRKACSLANAPPDVHYRYGVVLQELGRHAAARDQFTKAIGGGVTGSTEDDAKRRLAALR